VRLAYATAQPLARVDAGKDGIVYVFAAATDGPVELAFAPELAAAIGGAAVELRNGLALVAAIPGTRAAVRVRSPAGRTITLVVLAPAQARALAVADFAGRKRLILSRQQAWFGKDGLQLRAAGTPGFRFGVYPPLARQPRASAPLHAGQDGIFQTWEGTVPARTVTATATLVREARPVAPVAIGGVAKAALQPYPEAFKNAAAWRIEVPRAQLEGLDDALLEADFVGDIGRLFAGTRMLDDWYYSGYPWQVSLRQAGQGPLSLTVLPLRADAPVYIPQEARPQFGARSQIAELRGVRVTPVYRLRVTP
jgi:hypothetical protein